MRWAAIAAENLLVGARLLYRDMEAALASSSDVWPDLQQCPLHMTGLALRLSYEKQMAAVGLRSWREDVDIRDGICAHVRWRIFVSDQGPDQNGCSNLVASDLAPLAESLYIHDWCNEHICHLIAGKKA